MIDGSVSVMERKALIRDIFVPCLKIFLPVSSAPSQVNPFVESWCTKGRCWSMNCASYWLIASPTTVRWTTAEDVSLTAAVEVHGEHWFQGARMLGNGRTDDQCAEVCHFPVAYELP